LNDSPDAGPRIEPADPGLAFAQNNQEEACEEGHGFAEGAAGLVPADKVVLDGDLAVTILALRDSRCPEGVSCVWAGVAEVDVIVQVDGHAALHTLSTDHPGVVLGDRLLRLEDVSRAGAFGGVDLPAEVTLGVYDGAHHSCAAHTI
jgi:hypothetical protein